MKGRVALNLPKDEELNEFVEASHIKFAFWRNCFGSCQVFSFFLALCIFPRQLMRDIALSDDPVGGFIRASLDCFIKDGEFKNSHFYRWMPCETGNCKMLCGGVYKGLQKITDTLSGFQPDQFIVTMTKIFAKLDPDYWSKQLYVDLTINSLKDVRKIMSRNKKFFVFVDEMDLSAIESFVKGAYGRLSFILSLKVETSDGEEKSHAVAVVYSSNTKKFVRVCNGFPNVLSEVTLGNHLCNPQMQEDVSVVWAKIRFVGGALTRLKKAEKEDGDEGENDDSDMEEAEDEESEVEEENEDEESDDEEENEDEESDDEEENEDEESDDEEESEDEESEEEESEEEESEEEESEEEESEDEDEDEADECGEQLAEGLPKKKYNITFKKLPDLKVSPSPQKIEIRILADDGVHQLKWIGLLKDGEYACRKGRKRRCNVRGKTLKLTATEHDIKKHLVDHRACHTGVESRRRYKFPVQKNLRGREE